MTAPYLVEAYLDRIGALDKVGPTSDPVERRRLLDAANVAASEVHEHFEAMKSSGEMQEFTARFKASRDDARRKGRNFMGWGEYLIEAKRNSVMAIAVRHAGETLPVTDSKIPPAVLSSAHR